MKTSLISDLPQKKQAQLQSSNVVPPMYLSIESHWYDSLSKAVVYDIEVGVQCGQKVKIHKIRRRFSAMKAFDSELRTQFGDSNYLLPFPPKTIFPNTSEAFLEQRSEQLQKYLASLVKIPGISSSKAFTQFFEIDLSAFSEIY